MKENFWNTYPVIAAMALGTAGAALLFNGFYLLDGIKHLPGDLFKYQLRLGAAFILWIVGCGMTSRTRHGSWTRGLLCGLLFIPGLLIVLLTTGHKTRQEIWDGANPGLAGRAHRRHYRDVKPLY